MSESSTHGAVCVDVLATTPVAHSADVEEGRLLPDALQQAQVKVSPDSAVDKAVSYETEGCVSHDGHAQHVRQGG